MDLAAYQGGTGGKVRRRPFRGPSASPYDRPPTAVRALRGLPTVAESGGGWISKLVDPASRFIAGSTSKLFSSVFRKRLLAPTEVQGLEQNCQHAPESVDVALSESQTQEAVVGHNPTMDFGTSGISDIEQLLKQNIYTRDQVDYLTGLLYSRTFEPSLQEPENMVEKVNVAEAHNGELITNADRKFLRM